MQLFAAQKKEMIFLRFSDLQLANQRVVFVYESFQGNQKERQAAVA